MKKQASGGPLAQQVNQMMQQVNKTSTSPTKGGGTHTSVISASAKVPGSANGVMRTGAKAMTKVTSPSSSRAWDEARQLHAEGLISDAGIRKIAAMRQAILAGGETMMEKQASLAKRLAGLLDNVAGGSDNLRGRLRGGLEALRDKLRGRSRKITVGGASFEPGQVDEIADAVAKHKALPTRLEPGGMRVGKDGSKKWVPGSPAEYASTARAWVESTPADQLQRAMQAAGLAEAPRGVIPEVAKRMAVPAMFATAAMGGKIIDDRFDAARSERRTQAMLDAVPELGQEDMRRVIQAQGVIEHLAPTVASNPVAAGQIVKQLVNLGNLADVQSVKSLAETERNIQESRPVSRSLIEQAIGTARDAFMSPS